MTKEKVQKLEAATAVARHAMKEAETRLESATAALDECKAKLRALDPAAQQTLQVNDTELPDLIGKRMAAREEYLGAKQRFETNQRYLIAIRTKLNNG
ncbi:hypothetical protein THAOC_03818 [Thalassiosira oceanica]|uniref:Uncharacterized protein n=1 Tax=Thalassiosira oceanica TaxID=159749 RepID=K0TPI5_THAOC|nr:hypothetical protein THAOC_03818 [Thalassiosira oceanica]|eukprot:EJK74502.1 hypothetical protein THAOC_03818 [Thalassiosira oceanica]